MDVLLGICACISSNLCASAGVMLHKKLVDRRRCTVPSSSIYSEPMWQLGTSLTLGSLILDFVAFAFISVTIAGALSISSLIFNTIFARICIGEAITCLRLMAIICMVTGCGALIASQLTADNMITTSPTGHVVLEEIRDWRILAYTVITAIVSASITESSKMCLKRPSLLYATSAGIVASNCLLLTKLIVDLIKTYHKGATNDHATEWWLTFVILLVLILAGVFVQLWHMVQALENGSSIFGANIFGSTTVLFSIVCAGIVLDEFEYYALPQWILLTIGVVATVGGIVLMNEKEPPVLPCPARGSCSDVVL